VVLRGFLLDNVLIIASLRYPAVDARDQNKWGCCKFRDFWDQNYCKYLSTKYFITFFD